MADSPIAAVLQTLGALDVDATAALLAGDATLLRADGVTATGKDAVRASLTEFLAEVRSIAYDLAATWNPEPGVWIAQLTATYELSDFGRHGPYPRVFIVREGPSGLTELSIYGSHELPLSASEHTYHEVRAAGRWMPTL